MKKNDLKVQKKIESLKQFGVSVVCDDGSVFVNVQGSDLRVQKVARMILDKVGDIVTSDGVQEGEIFINDVQLAGYN